MSLNPAYVAVAVQGHEGLFAMEQQVYDQLKGNPMSAELPLGAAAYPNGLAVTDGKTIDAEKRYLNCTTSQRDLLRCFAPAAQTRLQRDLLSCTTQCQAQRVGFLGYTRLVTSYRALGSSVGKVRTEPHPYFQLA